MVKIVTRANELEFLRREAGAKTFVGLDRFNGAELEILRQNLEYEASISGVDGLNQGKYLV